MLKIVCLGFLPVLLAAMAQGGRAPLFLAFVIAYLAWRIRKTHRAGTWAAEPSPAPVPENSRTRFANRIAFVAGLVAATIYFAAIFLVRADSSPAGMLQAAEVNWGIGFRGFGGEMLLDVLGEQLTYLIFVFAWYLVSGLLMSNFLFTDYNGPAQFGIYGIDLGTALMRRIDANLVAQYFDTLMQVGTYGFLPSAFGCLYVDFSYFGLIICALWGYAAALVYRNAEIGIDVRWLLLVPFVTLGIVFSVVNTPLGFSNGFMIHVWLLVAFFLARRTQAPLGIAGVRRRIGQAR